MNARLQPAAGPDTAEPVWRVGGMVYRVAGLPDTDALQALLSDNAMDSWVRLSLERRPDYFAGERLMGESRTVIAHEARDPACTVGMYSYRCLPVHVNGVATMAGYLGELRVDRQYRHRIGVLRHGFTSIRHLVPADWQASGSFTSIADGNNPARRLLEAGLPGMPRYTPLGEMETLVFNTHQGRASDSWQPAEKRDIPALADFYNREVAAWQFSPVLSESWLAGLDGNNGLHLPDFRLLKNGLDIHGCIAIWDQRAFKQTVVRGYRTPLDILRAPYNLWARLSRRPLLPAAGEQLDHVFLAFAAFAALGHSATADGVRDALFVAGRKGARLGVLGLSTQNPLHAFLKTALKGSGYKTRVESVVLSRGAPMVLDTRPPQPEVAVL